MAGPGHLTAGITAIGPVDPVVQALDQAVVVVLGVVDDKTGHQHLTQVGHAITGSVL